jgi:hypothetical protein
VDVGEAVRLDTLQGLFPGLEGRMQLVRVMLDLKMPQLRDLPRDQQLDAELLQTLREAKARVEQG